jgi:hypothetical protein
VHPPISSPRGAALARPTDSRRERLKRQWLQQAEAAFELMFDAAQRDRLVTFDQREARACALTRERAAWLLEPHIAEDPAVRHTGVEAPAGPRCSRPARRATPPEDPLPGRSLTGAAGAVTLRRQRWYGPTCRAAFFPAGPQARPGDRGL